MRRKRSRRNPSKVVVGLSALGLATAGVALWWYLKPKSASGTNLPPTTLSPLAKLLASAPMVSVAGTRLANGTIAY
jgi:hypothetical protein